MIHPQRWISANKVRKAEARALRENGRSEIVQLETRSPRHFQSTFQTRRQVQFVRDRQCRSRNRGNARAAPHVTRIFARGEKRNCRRCTSTRAAAIGSSWRLGRARVCKRLNATNYYKSTAADATIARTNTGPRRAETASGFFFPSAKRGDQICPRSLKGHGFLKVVETGVH